jgi:transcriptional regulator with GAF, ATPase, and Fis domain
MDTDLILVQRVASVDSGRNRTVLSLDEINAQHIKQALEKAGGKINGPGGAAQILGLNPNTLRSRMNKFGIPYGKKSWRHPSKTGEPWLLG